MTKAPFLQSLHPWPSNEGMRTRLIIFCVHAKLHNEHWYEMASRKCHVIILNEKLKVIGMRREGKVSMKFLIFTIGKNGSKMSCV